MRFTQRFITALLATGCAWASAASFDCERARSKLNRVICSDAALSQLDSTVWNTYGELIRKLGSQQFMHVRERHYTWRRGRGLYETSVEALTHEYRSHLAWLTHPLLALEGRYERDKTAAAPAQVEIEVDVAQPDAVAVRGLIGAPEALVWRPAALADGGEPARVRPTGRQARFRPEIIGAPLLPADACELVLEFEDDRLSVAGIGQCGADFSGRYRKAF